MTSGASMSRWAAGSGKRVGRPAPSALQGGGRCSTSDAGFGFAVDYWQRVVGGEAVGVELADYGQVGARELGITVYDRLLQECPELAGRGVDVVYASEVIEHVPDPHAFVALLAKYVAPNGVLVLTTPAAEFVKPASHVPTVHAALAPGFHGFLLSAEAFAETARRCGFMHVDARVFGERQMLWASRASLAVDPTPAGMLPDFYAYLEGRLSETAPASPVWQGLAYRYVKELVNSRHFAEAKALAARLVDAVESAWEIDITDDAAVVMRLERCSDLAQAGRVIPYFLPNLYYFLGALAQHADRDAARARAFYTGSVACTLELARYGSVFLLEALSLLWEARAREAELVLAQGDIAGGAALFSRLAREGGECSARNGYAQASLYLLEATVPRLCEQLAESGHWAAAGTIFDGYRQHVTRRYGDALLAASGVETAAARGDDLPSIRCSRRCSRHCWRERAARPAPRRIVCWLTLHVSARASPTIRRAARRWWRAVRTPADSCARSTRRRRDGRSR